MTYSEAAKLARDLMDQHGLRSWKFDWMKAKRTCGQCQYTSKTISLSIHYVKANADDVIRNTILHEIAHAIAGYRAGHGPEWRMVCHRIGCIPSRLNHRATMPLGVWRANCPGCDHLYHKHRYIHKPGKILYCPKCGPEKGLLRFSKRGA